MKKVVIVGCSSLIVSAAELLDPAEMKVVGLGDVREEAWNVFNENGDIKETFDEMPVMPVDLAMGFEPDVVVVAAADSATADSLRFTVIKAGFMGDIIFLDQLMKQFSVRGAALRHAAERLDALGVEGSVAELGCYRGDLSWQLNVLMPQRTLHLFDTFNGLDTLDLNEEARHSPNRFAMPGRYADARPKELLARMPVQERVALHQGWFPETAMEIEDEKFALVVVDAGLYAPTLAALKFFFPRMAQGGMMFLCGLNDPQSPNVAEAVADFEKQYGALLMTRLGDIKGTAVVLHP